MKDLSVDDPVQAPPRRAHEDPAILAVSPGSFTPVLRLGFLRTRLLVMKTMTDVNE